MTNLSTLQQKVKDKKSNGASTDIYHFLNDVFGSDLDFRQPQRVMVGPDQAIRLLTRNTKNRNPSKNHVNWLSAQMEEELWHYTAEAIKFDYNGILLDKQHTLMAINQSGTSQKFIIECGLDPDAYYAIDGGKKRIPADVLSREGYKMTSLLAAVILKAMALRLRMFHGVKSKGESGSVAGGSKKIKSFIVNNENILLELRSDEDEYIEAARMGGQLNKFNKDVVPSFWGSVYKVFSEYDKQKAGKFLFAVAKGISSGENTPEYVLRRRIEIMNEDKRTKGVSYSPKEYVFHFITCFNKYLKGEPMHRVSAYKSGMDIPQLGE